jgi:hypothetical protein
VLARGWRFPATADLDRPFRGDVFKHHAGFSKLKDLIVTYRDEKRLRFLKGTKEKRMPEGYDFDGIYIVILLPISFAAAHDEFATFPGGDHRFDDRFSCKIHWFYQMLRV